MHFQYDEALSPRQSEAEKSSSASNVVGKHYEELQHPDRPIPLVHVPVEQSKVFASSHAVAQDIYNVFTIREFVHCNGK